MRAVEWVLSRETSFAHYPVVALLPDGRSVYLIKTADSRAFPALVVVFTVAANDEKIHLHDVAAFVQTGRARLRAVGDDE